MRWFAKYADPALTNSLALFLRGAPSLQLKKDLRSNDALTLAGLLVVRGISDPQSADLFLSPSLSHLHSPHLMSGMTAALERLQAAIERKEKVLIYGDYDVDGTTAIVILKTAIELCGGAADFHVPHRIRDGYGMKDDVIERASADGVRLIISVDTGIRAFEAADTARRMGIDRYRSPSSWQRRFTCCSSRPQSKSAWLRLSVQGALWRRRGVQTCPRADAAQA
jgi:hypothetical protein